MIKDIFAFLQSLFFGLLPPELPMNENGPPSKEATMEYRKAKRKWNRTVAMALWIIFLAGSFHITWACGWLSGIPVFKNSGFALAGDLSENKNQISMVATQIEIIAINQLRSQMLETRRLHCGAIADVVAGVPGAAQRRTTYFNELERLKEQYKTLRHGEAWVEPACDAL